jgi:NADPH:quinone reductase-like Zn-dependent oxidoreductase
LLAASPWSAPSPTGTSTASPFAKYGVRSTGNDPADRYFAQALPQLVTLIAAGELGVPVWRSYPLAQAVQAHVDIEARHNKGEVILVP